MYSTLGQIAFPSKFCRKPVPHKSLAIVAPSFMITENAQSDCETLFQTLVRYTHLLNPWLH